MPTELLEAVPEAAEAPATRSDAGGPSSRAAGRGLDHKYLVAFATMRGTFMEVLDTSVANVALPHMQGSYAAGTDEITWVITS